MQTITHDEAVLVCLTKEAIEASGALVIFLIKHPDVLPHTVRDRIFEADHMLNSSEDYYINDDKER